MKKIFILLFFIPLFMSSCANKEIIYQSQMVTNQYEKVFTGVEVLQQNDFEILKGQRVGLVTNPTGVNRHLESTVDILHESEEVNLVALFGPEHGVRGNFSAGDHVGNVVDEKTGLPVYSLYGKDRKPNAEALQKIDVMVYDIQDIGVRSYTYISTMGLVMEAAAEQGKKVVVLDRPNPLGGNRIEGPLVEEGYFSFVSQYKIPYVYGLTCGELAKLLNEEGLLSENKKCDLTVVPMHGWKRNMIFPETGLPWVPTSPHIPYWETAFYYASTGIIGEIDPTMIGIGYTLPFQFLATSNISAEKLSKEMNALNLPGILFRPVYFKPYYMDKKGEEMQGIQIHITDFRIAELTPIQFLFLQEAHHIDPSFNPFKNKEDRYQMFDYGTGSDYVRNSLVENFSFDEIHQHWNKDIADFKELARKYYMYE